MDNGSHDASSGSLLTAVLAFALLVLGSLAMPKRRKPEQHEKAISKESPASHNTSDVQSGEVIDPEPPETYNYASAQRQEHPIWKWLGRAGILAGIAYAIITYFMYRANRDAADAAKSAADIARKGLVISQRAYLTGLYPVIDYEKRMVYFQVLNSGHIPSSAAEVTTYEVTWNPPKMTTGETDAKYVVERHKQINHIPAVFPTTVGPSPISIAVPIPQMSKDRLANGTQLILVVAAITYDAGFDELKAQHAPVCIQTVYQTVAKSSFLVPCDPNVYFSKMEAADWTGRTTTY